MTRPKNRPVVAVIGAGFSGLLTTLNILRLNPDIEVKLIERRGVFGLGPAYATGNSKHLLNVRLGNMSAFPDQPQHLADWMAEQPVWQARDDFITRGSYGLYLSYLLEKAVKDHGSRERLNLIRGAVISLGRERDQWRLGLEGRSALWADAVVLAQGNLNPASPPGLDPDLPASGRYISNPWDACETVPRDADDILLIGSGLTMVDVAISLKRPGRRFTSVSRRGLMPRSHGTGHMSTPKTLYQGTPAEVFKAARTAARSEDWRVVVDDVRQSARSLWSQWDERQRGQFLRHLRALWDNHRHRLAPGVAREVTAMLADESLSIEAARLKGLTPCHDGIEVLTRARGSDEIMARRFDAVVNCTGPSESVGDSPEPLIRDLLRSGLARAAPLGLGLALDERGHLRDAQGRCEGRLFAIGPLTRSLFWEASAVPDLREQAVHLAHQVLGSLSLTVQQIERQQRSVA